MRAFSDAEFPTCAVVGVANEVARVTKVDKERLITLVELDWISEIHRDVRASMFKSDRTILEHLT